MTDNIIFQCDVDIDCTPEVETVEVINGEPVIVKENGDVFEIIEKTIAERRIPMSTLYSKPQSGWGANDK